MKIRFDSKKCTGCMACQMACIDQRDTSGQRPLRYVSLREGKDALRYHSIGCIHCGKCMKACTQNALERDAFGFVQVSEALCVGCGRCTEVCPLSVLTLSEGNAKKCDGCAARVTAGLFPACVHTCPTGALWLEE